MSTQAFISYRHDKSGAASLLDRLREVLMSDVSEDLFDRPLGPHADCFSTSQVVRMFEAGASPDELAHLLGCPVCHDLVTRSSKISRALDVGVDPRTSEGFGRAVRDLILKRPPGPQPTIAAVLGLSDPVVAVDDPHGDVTVICELMPCVGPSVDSIDPSSLRLEGAIAADSGTLTPTDGSTLPRVTFRKARLSKGTRRSLAHNARVVDQLRVSGSFTGEETRVFVGQAKVELVRPLVTSRPCSTREADPL
jgi:hypothetical protein